MFTCIFIGEVHGPIQFASGTGDQSRVREGCARPSLTLNAYCTRYTALHCTALHVYCTRYTAVHSAQYLHHLEHNEKHTCTPIVKNFNG